MEPGEGREEFDRGLPSAPVGVEHEHGYEPGPDPQPTSLIDQIAVAQHDPPVGVILIGWERPPGSATSLASGYPAQVEKSAVYVVTGCAGRSDRVLASADDEVAVIRSAMSGPATAEALAARMARQLEVELDRLAIEAGEPSARWAIGLVVGRDDDGPTDLVRYAERALGDAWLLGGRRVVAFDDGDRGGNPVR